MVDTYCLTWSDYPSAARLYTIYQREFIREGGGGISHNTFTIEPVTNEQFLPVPDIEARASFYT